MYVSKMYENVKCLWMYFRLRKIDPWRPARELLCGRDILPKFCWEACWGLQWWIPLGIMMINSAGDTKDKLRWGIPKINSAGDWRNFAEGGLPWFLAEDNPVISPREEITLNKTRERRPCSAGDKLPESTGEIDSTLLGKLLRLYWGMAPLGCLVFRRGTILY